MIASRLHIAVLARVDDPSWTTALSDRHVTRSVYCLTDLYLGSITYHSNDVWRSIHVMSENLAVVGHIAALAELLVDGADGTLHTYRNEWEMHVRHDGDVVRLQPNREDPLDVERGVLRLAVAQAADTTAAFIRSSQPPPHAKLVDELSHLAGRLRLHSV